MNVADSQVKNRSPRIQRKGLNQFPATVINLSATSPSTPPLEYRSTSTRPMKEAMVLGVSFFFVYTSFQVCSLCSSTPPSRFASFVCLCLSTPPSRFASFVCLHLLPGLFPLFVDTSCQVCFLCLHLLPGCFLCLHVLPVLFPLFVYTFQVCFLCMSAPPSRFLSFVYTFFQVCFLCLPAPPSRFASFVGLQLLPLVFPLFVCRYFQVWFSFVRLQLLPGSVFLCSCTVTSKFVSFVHLQLLPGSYFFY